MHNPTSKQVRLSQALQHRQPAARHTVCDRTCKIEGTPIPANNTWVSKLMPIPQVFAFATARNSVLNMPTNRLHHILQKSDKRLNQLDSFGGNAISISKRWGPPNRYKEMLPRICCVTTIGYWPLLLCLNPTPKPTKNFPKTSWRRWVEEH